MRGRERARERETRDVGGEQSEGEARRAGSIEREFLFDNLLVRIHFIIVIIRRTGLAP